MRPRALYSGVVIGCLAAGLARAEPPGMSPNPVPPDPPPHKSPALALGLGVGFTAVGSLALAADLANGNDGPKIGAAGVLIMYLGPSIGRWYGGGSAAIGLLSRGLGGAFIVAAINEDMNHPYDDCIPDPSLGETCEREDAARSDHDRKVKRLLYTGAAIWVASSVFDCVMAPRDARAFNREHGVAVVPVATPGGAGLAINGSF